jgi:hypothetical protein
VGWRLGAVPAFPTARSGAMAFGDPVPLAQFLERRLSSLECQPAIKDADAPPSQKQVKEATNLGRPTAKKCRFDCAGAQHSSVLHRVTFGFPAMPIRDPIRVASWGSPAGGRFSGLFGRPGADRARRHRQPHQQHRAHRSGGSQ